MTRKTIHRAKLLATLALVLTATGAPAIELEPLAKGPYPVGSTHFVVADEHADMGDEDMHEYLLGEPGWFTKRYVADVLASPEAAWIIVVTTPDDPDTYGPVSGESLPVAAFVTYPTVADPEPNRYEFPYHDAQYGVFEDMLRPGEAPRLPDGDERFPLIILSHGAFAHGIYDVGHAHELSRHGYIVAVVFYGDLRTVSPRSDNPHFGFLRALQTRALVDSLVESEWFGPRIDADRLGMSGHSFGGFTSLAIGGGRHNENPATVHDPRLKAAVLAAPWVGHDRGQGPVYAFGPENRDLERVTAPMLTLFGTTDDVTQASFILPATRKLGGPSYVVELVDQPHVFEGGSWVDRDNWERLFFAAFLKDDAEALKALATGTSMKGGNEDIQLLDYQRAASP